METTAIIPALATRGYTRGRLAIAYGIGAGAYAVGLGVSALFDLPAGPVIVWTLAVGGIVTHRFGAPVPATEAGR